MLTISDGIKKGIILAPTAILPASLRVSIREKLLANLELAIARDAQLLIIAHPKSGNTWLKLMLTYLYAIRAGISADKLGRYNELANQNPAIPKFAATNGYYSYEGAVGKMLTPDAVDQTLRSKPVVLLTRNPIDMAVSWYFQFTKRQSAHKQELINHFIEHPIDRNDIEMWDFVRNSDIGLLSLIKFLNSWEKNLAGHDKALLVRYEELRTSPNNVLEKIVKLMGDSFSEKEIQAAVDFASFDNLRKLESEGFFRQGGLTLRNPKDPESFKVRRAKIGGYHDYFSAEQVAELEQIMQDNLSPSLGYSHSKTV